METPRVLRIGTLRHVTQETPRILRLGALTQLTQMSKASIYRQIRAGTMPRPLRLGPRAVGWLREEIDEWLASRERAGSLTAAPKAEGDEPTERK